MSQVASTRLAAGTTDSPVTSPSVAQMSLRYDGLAAMPVPIAVPPRLISSSNRATSPARWTSSRKVVAKAQNSSPNVIGTASWSWVRPSLAIAAKLCPRSSIAAASRSSAAMSRPLSANTARRTAVA